MIAAFNLQEIYEYRLIPNFENYIISPYGVIRKIKGRAAPRIMKPKQDKDGYYYIGLRNEKGRFFRRVHRLVAMAYLENPNNYEIVNHKDGNKHNNYYQNLEWCDIQYNTAYSYHVLHQKGNITTNKSCNLYQGNVLLGSFKSILDAIKYLKLIEPLCSVSSLQKYKKWKNYIIKVKCND